MSQPLVQLNEYETDPYFLKIFQSNKIVCVIISVVCEPEIVKTKMTQESKQKQILG